VILGSESVDIAWGYESSHRFDFIANGWRRLAGGKLVSADRGAGFDKLRASVKANLPVAEFEEFVAYLAAQSAQDELQATLGAGEEIFGCELDYSAPYSVHLEGIGGLQVTRENPAFGTFSLQLLLAEAPRLAAGSGDWSQLVFPFEDETRYNLQAGSVVPMGVGATRFLDGQEGRTYSGNFELCPEGARAVKLAALQGRGAAIAFPLFAYKSMFGSGNPSNSAVILEWGAEQRQGLNIWRFPITFAKQY
jgi:hypothetical protein